MKQIYTILLVLLFVNAGAQIPNSTFDEWAGGDPIGWATSNNSLPGSVIRSDSGYNDTSAMQINVIALNDSGKNAGGFAYTNNQGTGTPDPSVPLVLLGWYKLKSLGGDLATVSVSVTSGGNTVGSGSNELLPDTSYQQFEVTISYSGSFANIDYSNINFQFEKAPNVDSLHAGTELTIDNLSYGYTASSGIPNITDRSAGNMIIYPNPSRGKSNIIYNVPAHTNVSLAVYDILGRSKKLLINEQQDKGQYNLPLNTSEFAVGVYFVRLLVNGESFNTPLVIN